MSLKQFFVPGGAFEGGDPDPTLPDGIECILDIVNVGRSAVDVVVDGPSDWSVHYEEASGVVLEGRVLQIAYPKHGIGQPIRFKVRFEVDGVRGEHTYEHRHYQFDLRRVKPPTEKD